MSRDPVGGATGVGDNSTTQMVQAGVGAGLPGGVDSAGLPLNVADMAQGQTGQTAQRERGLTYPITITNVSQEIQPVDHNRRFFFIQNNDPVGKITVSFGGSAATLNIGFNLAAGGGSLYMDAAVLTARIFAIGSIASNPNVTMITG
jgi:hypothetical protein